MIEGTFVFLFGVILGAVAGCTVSLMIIVMSLQKDCENGHKIHLKTCTLRRQAPVSEAATSLTFTRTH